MTRRQAAIWAGWGVVLAAVAHGFVALAESWDLGPAVRPLHRVFGAVTWPVVTTVVVGLPIGAMFHAAARLTRPDSAPQLALLVGPFAALQFVSLANAADLDTLAYALVFTATATAGALACRSVQRRRAGSRPSIVKAVGAPSPTSSCGPASTR